MKRESWDVEGNKLKELHWEEGNYGFMDKNIFALKKKKKRAHAGE